MNKTIFIENLSLLLGIVIPILYIIIKKIIKSMKLTDFLIGKKINVMTDAKVVVQLVVKSIDEKSNTRTIELEPATPQNDWWPKSESYTTHYFLVTFVNGFTKKYNNINEIEIAE